jgi:hypothetical protein
MRLANEDRRLLLAILFEQRRIAAQLQLIFPVLRKITNSEKVIMSVLDEIEAEVASNTSVVGSVEILVQNMTAKIQEQTDGLAAAGVDTTRMQAVLDAIKSNDTRLGALVNTNTPAPPEPVPEPTPPEERGATAGGAAA